MDPLDTSIPSKQWCLEEAALRLSGNFPRHHIVIIKPTRTLFDHVSSFDNFVISNILGSPKHVFRYDAISHLQLILQKISKRIKITPTHKLFKMLLKRQVEEDYLEDSQAGDTAWQIEYMAHNKKKLLFRWQKRLHLDSYPLTLVGFSKGCVVLNQFLYEFHYARRLEPDIQESGYIDRIKCIYWLDAAHPGRENVYISSRAVLKTLKDLDIELHNHVSQYQTEDLKRPWIRRQWLEFTETLKQFKARITTCIHDRSTDLTGHYNIFLNFTFVEATLPPSPRTPPPLPPPPRPAPPPAYPPRQADQQQQTTPEHSERIPQILGVSLISPQTDPYLGIQMILREPLDGPSSSTENSSDSDSSSDRNSQSDGQQPYSPDQNPSTSAQHPSTSAQVPFTSSQEPSTFAAENVSDSAEHPSTSRSGGRAPSADSFTILMKKPNLNINFSEDLAAAEDFRTARYYKIEAPMIATLSTNPLKAPGICVYAPVKETYVPLAMNSTKAATPRGSIVVPPVVNRVDMPGTVASNMQAAPEAFNRQANSGPIGSQFAMQSHPNPTVTQSQAAPWAVQPQSDPRVAQSQSTSVVTQSQAYPRATQALAMPWDIQPQSEPMAVQSLSTSRAMLLQIAAQLQTDPLTVESQTAPSSMESNPIPIQPNLAFLPYEEQPSPRVTRRSPRFQPQNRNSPYSGNGRSSSSCYNLRSLPRSHLLDE